MIDDFLNKYQIFIPLFSFFISVETQQTEIDGNEENDFRDEEDDEEEEEDGMFSFFYLKFFISRSKIMKYILKSNTFSQFS